MDESARNTSGQGKSAVVPDEIKGWSWAAFFGGLIWGLAHRVWLSILIVIPCFGFIIAIIIAANGNERAWQNKRWESVEHFKRVQSLWAYWCGGIIFFLLLLQFIAIAAEM